MAPNFLSKLVKANGTLGVPSGDHHTRSRTTSNASHHGPLLHSATMSGAIETAPAPKLVLTTDLNESSAPPASPGSIHRSGSPRDANRPRSASLPKSNKSSPVSTPRKNSALDLVDMPHTTSPENDSSPFGLGIQLGQGATSTASPSAAQNAVEALKRKTSNRSLNKQTNGETSPQYERTHGQNRESVSSARSIMQAIVESPTATTPPSGANVFSDGESSNISTLATSISTTTQSSLQPRSIESDAVSIASSTSRSQQQQQQGQGKKMTWRRPSVGSSNKKRKPTGLASAIAASGLAMANPGVAQPLAQFAPQPQSPTKSPPRVNSNNSRTSPYIDQHGRPRQSSLTYSNGDDPNGDFYSDMSDEDELDLDDEEIPVTGFAVASPKRNAEFHELFPSVPEGDYLIEDYGCALQREILIQGRFYISENHVCFHANIFGWVTDVIIPVHEIQSIEKKMTALIIPNAIQITTRTAKYTFASFLSRDTTYDVVYNVWRLCRPDAESIGSGNASARVSLEDTQAIMSEVDSTENVANGDSTGSVDEGAKPVRRKKHRATQCKCGRNGEHYSEVAMSTVFPGTPEKIYNLMFASGFIKDFMREDQKLKDLQISDWCPDPTTKVLSRNFSYIKPLYATMGPKETKCELKDETVHCDFDDYISNITTTRTPDVPSGGVFSVKTRTCIMWASSVSSKVIVTTQVEWTGRSFIKSIINNSAIDGQKTYHNALERAMRAYIQEHTTEFIPEGVDAAVVEKVAEEETTNGFPQTPTTPSAFPLSEEEASKRREHERNQRATQWAFDTIMGAWKVAKQSTVGALDLISDAWDQSSTSTILWFVIVVLVISNLWTLVMVGRREEIGRRKEMRKVEDQRRWVASIVTALWEERARGTVGEGMLPSIPSSGAVSGVVDDWRKEVGEMNRMLDAVEERVRVIRTSLKELD